MGNFYTNVTLRTTERQAVIDYMRARKAAIASFRRSFGGSRRFTTAWAKSKMSTTLKRWPQICHHNFTVQPWQY
jgi:hypothetical protein